MTFGLNYINSFSNEKPDGNVFYSPINSINITNNIYNISERDEFGNLQAVEPTRVNPLTIIDEYDITQETNRVIAKFPARLQTYKRARHFLRFWVRQLQSRGEHLLSSRAV